MQSLVPLALLAPPQGKLRVANPDRSRVELTRALSDASVYSTASALPETQRSSSSAAASASLNASDRVGTAARKGKDIARAVDLADLPIDSDDPSDVDVVLRSVLGDLRRNDNVYATPEDKEIYLGDYDVDVSGSMDQEAASTPQRPTSSARMSLFSKRVQQKLVVSRDGHVVQSPGDSYHQDDEEQTPRISYAHIRRSDPIQISAMSQPGIPKEGPCPGPMRDHRPPVPPRSVKRPRSTHNASGRPQRSSVRGPRCQPQPNSPPHPSMLQSKWSSEIGRAHV